jgi:TatD DNase family protein
MLFDSHCHLNFEAFNDDWAATVADCKQQGVEVVVVGSQLATSTKAVDIADQSGGGIYAAVGLHPTHVLGSPSFPEPFTVDAYRALVTKSKNVVAIGETGIDFFHDASTLDQQREVFVEHLRLAKEFDLPVIIHGRNSRDGSLRAYDHILELVDQEKITRAVVHCFGDNWQTAQPFIERGFYVGFTGIVTFPKSEALQEIAQKMPLEQLLIETDAPYLAPMPNRGKKNYPQYVRFVAEQIAELRGITFDEVAEQTYQNGRKLFVK